MLFRKCVVCGKRTKKSELLRFVLQDDKVVFDGAQVLPGRGAYLTKEGKCIFAPSVVSLLKASILKTKLDRKAKRTDEKDLIAEILKDWEGLEKLKKEKPKPGIRL